MLLSPKIEDKLFSPFCASEFGRLKKVVICKPSTIDVGNLKKMEHFGFKDFVTASELMRNYEELYMAFLDHGIQVYDFCNFIDESEEYLFNQCVNRIYTRDVAAILGNGVFFGTAKLKSRIQEFSISQKILRKIVRTTIQPQSMCEFSIELGDLLIINKRSILINFGLRTNHNALKYLFFVAWSKGFEEVTVISLPDSLKKIHLDLVCNVVSEKIFSGYVFLKQILVTTYQRSGEEKTQSLEKYLAEREIRVVWFDNSDVDSFITNYLIVNNNLIFANKEYKAKLEGKFSQYGIEVLAIDLRGFEKGGGSMRCLTLPLERDG